MKNFNYDTQKIWEQDRDHQVHPWTDFATFKESGSLIVAEAEGDEFAVEVEYSVSQSSGP